MSDLDTRVAIEIMGEPQPTWQLPEAPGPICVPEKSEGGAWWRGSWNHHWKPQPFSTNLEYATRAIHAFFGDDPVILMEYYRSKQSGELKWMAYADCRYGYGTHPAQAICDLLLTLSDLKAQGYYDDEDPPSDQDS